MTDNHTIPQFGSYAGRPGHKQPKSSHNILVYANVRPYNTAQLLQTFTKSYNLWARLYNTKHPTGRPNSNIWQTLLYTGDRRARLVGSHRVKHHVREAGLPRVYSGTWNTPARHVLTRWGFGFPWPVGRVNVGGNWQHWASLDLSNKVSVEAQ